MHRNKYLAFQWLQRCPLMMALNFNMVRLEFWSVLTRKKVPEIKESDSAEWKSTEEGFLFSRFSSTPRSRERPA